MLLLKALSVIQLTRLNRTPLVLNSELIEHIEITPDTVISLSTGQKIVVRESADEVVERVIAFRRAVYQGILNCPLIKRNQEEMPPKPESGSN